MIPALLVIGDANADVNAELTRFPHEGDDCPLHALGWSSGGSAANVATALALLGARARLLARVGVDPAAAVALRAAEAAKVDLDLVQRDAAIATGICFAAVSPGGERTFFSHRGANSALDGGGSPDPLEGASWVHIAGHALLEGSQRGITLALALEAQRRGIPVSLDLCLPLLRSARQSVLELLPRLAVVFANELELPALVGAPCVGDLIDLSLDRFSRDDGPVVAAKLGARGSRLGGRARADLPAFPVTARDTTGAGDAYVAGFLFALARGAEPAIAALLGNALGALTATRKGAADALPSRDEVRAFLELHGASGALPLLAAPPSE
ncbi:MAG: carbohydrate kinase family protein [Byssovorax sp.]